ncbi:MAG: M20/M25/M40 family metallo-hydrolase [Parvibaculaceae bacterium]
MIRAVSYVLVFVLSLWAASHLSQPPVALGSDVPLTTFSATRAMLDVETIAARPHPIGSTDILRVRQYVRARAVGLGLTVEPDAAAQTVYVPARAERVAIGATVHNIIATLKGTSPELPALLLMAHYDTVANSAGAPDDTAGVASMLGIAANLKAKGALKRDVIFLFTEGEEAGLLGARAFFTQDPLAKHVGLVINLESRGGGGRAFMFETSSNAGGLIDTYGKAVRDPAANSLSAFLYHNMPNGTDLTTAFDAKIPGLNFAFIGDEYAYHTASATPDSLNRGSLQHMGAQALSLVSVLGNADDLRVSEPDRIYGDLFGALFFSYSFAAGWGLIALLAGLIGFATWKARADRLVGGRSIAIGLGFFLLLLVVEGIVFFIAGRMLVGSFDVQAKYTMIGRYDFYIGGVVLLALAAAWALALSLRRYLTLWGPWLGGLVLLFVIALGLQIAAPATTLFVVWPLVPVALAAALLVAFTNGNNDTRLGLIIALPLAFLSMIQIAGYGAAVFLGLGGLLPLVIILPVLVAAIALYPALDALIRLPRSSLVAGVVLLAAFISLGWAKYGPASAAHPRLTQAFYMAGPADDQFTRVSMLKSLDAWSDAALSVDGGTPELLPLEGYAFPAWQAKAKPAAVPRPILSGEAMNVTGAKRVTLKIVPANRPRELRFILKADADISDLAIDGIPTPVKTKTGEWTQFLYAAPSAEGITLTFTAKSKGSAALRVFEVSDGWPDGIAVPPKPEGYTSFYVSDTTYAASALDYAWDAPQ